MKDDEQGSAIGVTPATGRDLPLLFSLAATAFANEPGWNGGDVVNVLTRDRVFVARVGRETVGYVAIHHDRSGWRIDQLLVAVGHERRGIGKLLLAYAEALAEREHAPSLRIVCEERNVRARDLYRRFGFAPVGRELWERALLPR
jgi:ribosomal protein S18 acetylase RimI-like enzyme